MTYIDKLAKEYETILQLFIYENAVDEAIARCQTFSQNVIEIDTSPEEIVSLHIQMLNHLHINDGEEIKKSLEILEEVMISFGFTYRDYRAMLDQINHHDQELEVAASVQRTMLKSEIPIIDNSQLGAISVAAGKVNGDYFNILKQYDDKVGIAVADVIGSGIPASIAMAMLKFSLELSHLTYSPHRVLEKINDLVEQNINKNMFITMFYAVYDYKNFELTYASAGHEPALIYRYEDDIFETLDTRDLVLGVMHGVSYKESTVSLNDKDMIFIYTDGVSELRKHDGTFIDMEDVKNMIRDNRDEHPQDIVRNLYQHLTRMQDQTRKDDLTCILIKTLH
ncbi:SpoIIE family protein phosphatase [Nosocomiicoccus massiliensis]|uniref:SpoIIE family protein phosphatase n=1 Tax=Nosocomiicoccus massiliensis TaxID=1232430 RepID=UPI0004021007|nr:PP2C family protein-serine/threonine phosphatase [Nosocomiicoccus massiliensis]